MERPALAGLEAIAIELDGGFREVTLAMRESTALVLELAVAHLEPVGAQLTTEVLMVPQTVISVFFSHVEVAALRGRHKFLRFGLERVHSCWNGEGPCLGWHVAPLELSAIVHNLLVES